MDGTYWLGSGFLSTCIGIRLAVAMAQLGQLVKANAKGPSLCRLGFLNF
jgi:hypothetical protein